MTNTTENTTTTARTVSEMIAACDSAEFEIEMESLPHIIGTLQEAHGVLTHYAERVRPFHFDLSQKAETLANSFDTSTDVAITVIQVFSFLQTMTPEPDDSYVMEICAELEDWMHDNIIEKC